MDSLSSFSATIESSERLPIVTAGPMPTPDSAVLFILCAYRREDAARESGLLTRLTLGLLDGVTMGRLRSHRALLRDHYANPRSLAYLIGLVRRFQRQLDLRRAPDILVDRSFGIEPGGLAGDCGRVERADLHDPRQSPLARDADEGRYHAVVLVWPDALGLGQEALQRRTSRLPLLIAMNGRRRAFTLDSSAKRALSIRRYFAHTRLAETVFALCIFPIAGVCALIDAIRRP